MAERNPDGTFAKGSSGGPGRKPGAKLITPLLRAKMESVDPKTGKLNAELYVEKIVELALEGERWAAELVFERLDGRVPHAHVVEQTISEPIKILDFNDPADSAD